MVFKSLLEISFNLMLCERLIPYTNHVCFQCMPLNDEISLDGSPENPIDVMIFTKPMSYSNKVWGEDVDRFRPERHLEVECEIATFSAGIRNCIGKHFAINFIKIFNKKNYMIFFTI